MCITWALFALDREASSDSSQETQVLRSTFIHRNNLLTKNCKLAGNYCSLQNKVEEREEREREKGLSPTVYLWAIAKSDLCGNTKALSVLADWMEQQTTLLPRRPECREYKSIPPGRSMYHMPGDMHDLVTDVLVLHRCCGSGCNYGDRCQRYQSFIFSPKGYFPNLLQEAGKRAWLDLKICFLPKSC